MWANLHGAGPSGRKDIIHHITLLAPSHCLTDAHMHAHTRVHTLTHTSLCVSACPSLSLPLFCGPVLSWLLFLTAAASIKQLQTVLCRADCDKQGGILKNNNTTIVCF